MKKFVYALAALATLLSVSCSSDDDSSNGSGETNYLPLTDGNYWIYDVTGSAQNGRDSVYIAHDTLIGTNTYKKIKTATTPYGFFSSVVNNNGVRKDGDAYKVSGSTAVSFSEDFPFSIAVNDLVVFKESATTGQTLGTVTGTIEQEYEGLPLEFDYTLTTTADETLPSYSINGHSYTNVKKVKATVNLSINYSLGGIPIAILAAQDVVTSYQYYAQGIGVVNVETVFTYTINDAFATTLGIEPTTTETQVETLDTYNME